MTHQSKVEAWYDTNAVLEERRLDEGRLEFEVTMRVIKSSISNLQLEKARILDVGGGPGRYAIALSKLGHKVILNDLSSKSLDIALRNAESQGVDLARIVHGDARELLSHPMLAHEAEVYDMVLCLGPLYHILPNEDRTGVLRNCIGFVKPGGYVLAAYVSVYAHLRDMARRDPGRLSKEWDFYSSYLSTGHYTRNPLTESFHVYPRALKEELAALNEKLGRLGGEVKVERIVSCEGFLGFEGAKALKGLSEAEMEKWVDVVMSSAEEVETLNAADHLLVVLKKEE